MGFRFLPKGFFRGALLLAVFMNASGLRAQDASSGPGGGAMQAFVLTSTYGVIAGSLTGLASLAFYDKPGSKLRNVAMGASLGLYIGILLGAYLVYAPAPGSASDEEDNNVDEDPIRLDGSLSMPKTQYVAQWQAPKWQPIVSYIPEKGMNMGLVYRF